MSKRFQAWSNLADHASHQLVCFDENALHSQQNITGLVLTLSEV